MLEDTNSLDAAQLIWQHFYFDVQTLGKHSHCHIYFAGCDCVHRSFTVWSVSAVGTESWFSIHRSFTVWSVSAVGTESWFSIHRSFTVWSVSAVGTESWFSIHRSFTVWSVSAVGTECWFSVHRSFTVWSVSAVGTECWFIKLIYFFASFKGPLCSVRSFDFKVQVMFRLLTPHLLKSLFNSNSFKCQIIDHWDKMSHATRKPVYAICEQQRRRSACASAQFDQRLWFSLPLYLL